MPEAIYTGSATSTGGGRDGHVRSHDGQLDFDVRPPKEMGGAGDAPNPETLFAAAWATCFNGALQMVMKNDGISVEDHQPTVTAEVTFNKVEDGLRLSGIVLVKFENQTDLEDTEGLVAKAHHVCPYSRAVRGEFDAEARLA